MRDPAVDGSKRHAGDPGLNTMEKYFQHETALVAPTAHIGQDTRIWAFVNIKEDAVIGNGCNICDGCYVEKGAVIGNNVTLKNGVNVFEGVTLQDNVFCGTNVAFINDRYPRSRNDQWVLEKTCVKTGATIGSNATVLCGVTIGEYAVVGAGSVVTQDVADYTIVTGNPAHVKGYACCCGKKLAQDLKCHCGLAYTLSGQSLKPKE